MKIENVHTLVLGAGPSGLAAGYVLAKAGLKPVVLEKDAVPGGLMRSIRHGDFILDIGRKELYNRLEKVDTFWSDLLGGDYRTYVHRGGLLYGDRILDMSAAYAGVRRGLSWGGFAACAADFLWWRAKGAFTKPRNLEEYWYLQRGRRITRLTNQGFQEKLVGRKWAEVALPETISQNGHAGFGATVKAALKRTFSTKETNTYKGVWKHPAKGTGQICEALADGITKAGGAMRYRAKIQKITGGADRVESVTAEIDGEPVQFNVQHLISSTPADFLAAQLWPDRKASAAHQKVSSERRRVVILVYLLMHGEPKFPHFWLQVTCPTTRIGRIANFAALNADMMPRGKHALCLEIYCFGEDPLLKLDDQAVAAQAFEDCVRAKIVDRAACFDKLVLRFPGADASQNRHNWLNSGRQQLLVELRQFRNLYSVNRTDLDIATLAGLESAEAVLSGDRSAFDLHIDPRELGIRSESKPFEFRNPPGVQL
jgi:protoporphyrinogen oxidase